MFNQRRKHSAYLEYDDGKIKSTEPNSTKEKVQNIINSHKKEDSFTSKDFISLLLFLIITITFILLTSFFIKYISISMNSKTSNYKVSNTISKTTSNINLTERKNKENVYENMSLLLTSVNNYNTEITSIYSTLKGYISIYYNGKEGRIMTQRSLTAMEDRIDLDISIIKNDEIFKNQEKLKNLYINRFENIRNYLQIEINDKEKVLNDLNKIILKENDLYKKCDNEISNILENNQTTYVIMNNKYQIQK